MEAANPMSAVLVGLALILTVAAGLLLRRGCRAVPLAIVGIAWVVVGAALGAACSPNSGPTDLTNKVAKFESKLSRFKSRLAQLEAAMLPVRMSNTEKEVEWLKSQLPPPVDDIRISATSHTGDKGGPIVWVTLIHGSAPIRLLSADISFCRADPADSKRDGCFPAPKNLGCEATFLCRSNIGHGWPSKARCATVPAAFFQKPFKIKVELHLSDGAGKESTKEIEGDMALSIKTSPGWVLPPRPGLEYRGCDHQKNARTGAS